MSLQSQPLKAIVIDDEPLAARLIDRYLRDDSDIEVLQHCGNGVQALHAIRELHPDLLFLDVQMPGMNGFQMLRSLSDHEIPFVIFITAHDEYAIQAFEVHALDYLLKPFDEERFKKAVKHAKSQIRLHQEQGFIREIGALLERYKEPSIPDVQSGKYQNRLEIRSTGQIQFIPVDQIHWIEASDNYVVLHTANAKHLLRESMSQLETKLDPARFLRVHRSAIIQLSRVRELATRRFGDRVVILQDGTEVRVSRVQKIKLQKLLTQR